MKTVYVKVIPFGAPPFFPKTRDNRLETVRKLHIFLILFSSYEKTEKSLSVSTFETQTIIKITKTKVNITDLKENKNHVRG